MRFLSTHAQHIGTRSSQQDSFGFGSMDRAFMEHAGLLAIVCDGMGGMEHGDAASRIAVEAFLSAYQETTEAQDIPTALLRSARHANAQVVAFSLGLNLEGGVGTTLVAVAIQPTGFYYISIGDSGIFRCSEGSIEEVNHPHVFANYLAQAVESGKMSAQEAQNHPDREALTSFVGMGDLAEIDQNREPQALQAGESMLLASDGMFKTLTAGEIEVCLTGYPPDWPQILVDRVLSHRRVYQDNVTVISVTLDDESNPLIQSARTAPVVPSGPPPLPPPLPS